MKIGIIGCGYVGQAAALHWKRERYQVAATTRRLERVEALRSIVDDVYLLNSQPLSFFIAQQDIILISVAPDASSDYTTTYLDTAKQVVQQAILNTQLQYILYTSSTSVYGDHGGDWVDETTPVSLLHHHAKILYETEQTLLNCTLPHLKVCIMRLGEIYGPGREISDRLRRLKTPLPGTGESYTNLIHITDIVKALDFALKNKLEGIYNLCNDDHLPRRLFYEQICEKESIPVIQWDISRISLHAGNKRVSNQKFKQLGFQFSGFPY